MRLTPVEIEVLKVREAQAACGIPWDWVTQQYHEGLRPEVLQEQVAHWESRAAEVEAERAAAIAEFARDVPVTTIHGTRGGRRVSKKTILDDESYLGGDNRVCQADD